MSDKKKHKLSVIVPVYNIQNYIEKNIKSLIQQDIDMEIIYVDDGSTDESINIVESYLPIDHRIKVVRKENGGLSSARNYGLMNSSGDYVIFIDGDDYVEINSLLTIYNEAVKSSLDIIQGCYKKVYEDDDFITEDNHNGSQNPKEIVSGKKWLLSANIIPMVWLYMYKREFLIKNNLMFYEGIYHEDLQFTPRAIYYAEKISSLEVIFYNYVQRKSSIVNTKNIKKCYDMITIAQSISEFKDINIKDNELTDYFNKYIVFLYSYSIHSAILQDIPLKEFLIKKELKDKLVQEIKKSSKLKYKIMAFLLKYKAYKLYSYLYKLKKDE